MQEKVSLDLGQFDTLLHWLISHGCPAFKDICPPRECPKPVVVQEKATKHNTDETQEAETEETFEGGRFFFPDAHEPTQETGAFQDERAFATAMLKGTSPTLLFHGGEYANIQELQIEDIFPICFPFGKGGVNEQRRNPVSPVECLKHYMRLSLPHMKRSDFILVVCSMYHQIKSFTSGFLSCKTMLRGQTLAEQVSLLTADDIIAASDRANINKKNNGTGTAA